MKHAARWGSVLFTAAILSKSARARAAEGEEGHTNDSAVFGSRGSWGVLLEHVAGVSYHRFSFPGEPGNRVQKSIRAEAFRPDIAMDAFITDHLSLGARMFYRGGSTTSSGGPPQTTESSHMVQVYPRIGFAYSWPSRLGLWAQASVGVGVTWSSASLAGLTGGATDDHHSEGIAGGLTLLGTYSLGRHVVLTAGPWVLTDLARFGDPYVKDATPFGLSAGAGVYF